MSEIAYEQIVVDSEDCNVLGNTKPFFQCRVLRLQRTQIVAAEQRAGLRERSQPDSERSRVDSSRGKFFPQNDAFVESVQHLGRSSVGDTFVTAFRQRGSISGAPFVGKKYAVVSTESVVRETAFKKMLRRESSDRRMIRQRLGETAARLAIEIRNHRYTEPGELVGMGIVHDMRYQPVELADPPFLDHLKPPVVAHLGIRGNAFAKTASVGAGAVEQ